MLSGDLETAIRALKARPGGELQVHGSGQLIRWLLERELVDEMTLIVCPVIVGAGTRLFPEAGRDFALELRGIAQVPDGHPGSDLPARPADRSTPSSGIVQYGPEPHPGGVRCSTWSP